VRIFRRRVRYLTRRSSVGVAAPGDTESAYVVTDSDLTALSLRGIRVTGYEALIITRCQTQEIENLLASVPAQARIDGEAAARCSRATGPHGCYKAAVPTFWGYLGGLRSEAGVDHLPVLRVLDIIGWMYARPWPSDEVLATGAPKP
jgi:hypothetical protein